MKHQIKKTLLLVAGITFTIGTIGLYMYLEAVREPEEAEHGLGEFFFFIFAFLFNIIFWGAVVYAISQLEDKSRCKFLNVLGAFLIGLLPLYLIFSMFISIFIFCHTILWYLYGFLIIITGILSLFCSVKEHNSKHRLGAFCIIVIGCVCISILLFLRIPWW